MGLADTVTKAYMKDNSVFADAFNYLIYGGEAVVDPKQLQELDTTEIALPFGSQDEEGKQPEEAVQKYRDVLKSAIIKQDDEAAYILLGIENQTDIHYAMPVRNIIYDALQYGKQLDTQHSLDLQETAINEGKDDFMERIRAMYVAGGADSYTNVLINSSDFYDILMRIELVTRVAKHDNDELNELLDQYKKLEKTKAELDEQIKQLKAKAEEYAKEQKTLAGEQAELLKMEQESGKLIEQIKNDKSDLENKSHQVDNKYAEVSSKANTTTTATTTKKKTTTTKKSGNSGEKTTTTKKPAQTEKPDETTVQTTTTPQETAKPKPETSKKTTTTTTAAPAPKPDYSSSSKIDTVVSYAKSMVGGAYVWGGSQFGATDCSGLVMLSFAQVGINLPHYAASQALYGTTVSYNNMKKGDVIFFGGASISSIYHVAIYIGDGKMVHAQNTATGIVISNVEYFSRYNNITIIKRLI